MKRSYLWISMLLALTLLLCSCTNLFQRESATTGTEEESVAPNTLLGKWYCADVYAVIELKEDLSFDYYGLVTDDYAYAFDVTVGKYTLSGNTVTLPLEEDFEVQITYNQESDSFAIDGADATFSRVELLPQKLPTADPQKFKGIWYHEFSKRVYDLHEDGTVDTYAIQAGYYSYSATESATYTVKDATIEILYEGSDTPVQMIYNASKNSLADIVGNIYTRVNELPQKHPTAVFPKYDELDCTSVITLGSYKGRDLTTNAKIYAALDIFESYFSANKDKKPVAITEDRAAVYGDRVVIDYTGYLDGKAFTGGSATDQTISLVENSGYIPGFAEGVIGHKMGETFDVPVTFPENYGNKDMAGKSVIFTMTLHTICDLSIADEEIKTFSKDEFSTYADMLAYYVKAYREQEIWSILQEESKYVNLSGDYYNYFYYYYRDQYHSAAFSNNMTYEKILEYYGLTEAILLEEAQKVARPYIIAQAIFTNEKLEWNEETYQTLFDQYVKDAMEYFKCSEEEAKKYVNDNEADNLKATVTREIVTEWLLTQNN